MVLPRWAQLSGTLPWWQLLPSIVWAFVPALALLSLPFLTTKFADRVFGFVNLYKSMLGIFVWLGLTGSLGAINGAIQLVVFLRRLAG